MRFFWLRRVFPFRSFLSLIAARCSDDIQKYLGITLLPQAGVALGMAATAAQLSDGHMVRNVVLFSVPVERSVPRDAPAPVWRTSRKKLHERLFFVEMSRNH